MYTMQLTTVTARYTKTPSAATIANPLDAITKHMPEDFEWYIELYKGGELVFSHGHKNLVPEIWTHTPIPVGMDIVSLKQRFEMRAASVLGDYDTKASFIKCNEVHNHAIKDNRYYDPTIRAAWMIYLDQAIQHHDDAVIYSNI